MKRFFAAVMSVAVMVAFVPVGEAALPTGGRKGEGNAGQEGRHRTRAGRPGPAVASRRP